MSRSGQLLLGLLALAAIGPGRLRAQGRVVLRDAVLIDGRGGASIEGARIVIEAGRFSCVSGPDGCPAQPGDRVVDLTGRWITPGLIDTHVHLPFAIAPDGLDRLQRLRFALGITTVRDAGSRSVEELLARRAEAESGSVAVPRLVVAARVTPEYAERFGAPLGAPLVARLAAMGVNAIKLKEPFLAEATGEALWPEEITAAHDAGLPVFGHTWGGPPAIEFTLAAVQAGIDGVSHLGAFPLATQAPGVPLTPPDSATEEGRYAWHRGLWQTVQAERLDTLLDAMVRRGTWLEPTLVVEYHWGRAMEPPPEVPFLGPPPTLRELVLRQQPPAQAEAAFPGTWSRESALVAAFVQRGGMVIAGSDGKAPGIGLHEEIRLIRDAAGSPMAGLLAATRDAAVALRRDDLGTVEPGKLADAVIYAADPLGPGHPTLAIAAVVKGGVIHQADTLQAEFRAEREAAIRAAWHGRIVRGGKLLAGLLGAGLVLLLLWRWRRGRSR